MQYTTLSECLTDVQSYNGFEDEVKEFVREIGEMTDAESMFQRAINKNDDWLNLAQQKKLEVLLNKKEPKKHLKRMLPIRTLVPVATKRELKVDIFGQLTDPTPVIVLSIE